MTPQVDAETVPSTGDSWTVAAPGTPPKLFEQEEPPLTAPAETPKDVQYEAFVRPSPKPFEQRGCPEPAPDTAGSAQGFRNAP